MIIQCTKKLLDRIKINDDAPSPVTSETDLKTRLHSWHANIVTVADKKTILFMNDASGLAVICYRPRPSDYKRLPELVREGTVMMMDALGISNEMAELYLADDGEPVITRTSSKSMLSKMVQLTYYLEAIAYRFKDSELLQRDVMIRCLDYVMDQKAGYYRPGERFKECLEEVLRER
jgi:hypothetical protein